MSNIKVMDELLSNKIAAGEVVEKIVSIVKELTENSIDAKSSEIKIELIESGLREIKVVDNGIGMDKNDAKLCFQRHATSKLYTDDDLFSIETLGFRGEALPSIATVSDVVLKTCQKGSSEGTMIHIKGGKIIEESSSELRYGTSFTVTNLFYNTPARLKHLSSPYSELSNVIDYVNKISLSYPSIKFTLINDGKYLLNTDGSGNILKVINAIYGLDVTKRMFPIEGCNQDYNIKGFISLPELNRASKNYITTLVNGRVIKNATLYRVINEAYSNYKEDSRYPIVVLYIETDPSLIDVNIHPSKLDIKFSNFEDLTELIKATIIKGIKQKLLIPQVEPTKEITPSIEKNKYEMIFLIHPTLISNKDDYDKNKYVKIYSAADVNYEDILTEAKLMITDYSGVQYDFAYMNKPVIYFHTNDLPPSYGDGMMNYKTMGFGPIVENENELVNSIKKIFENKFKNEKKYADRVNKFFEYRDYNSCKRIYEVIAGEKDDKKSN